MSEPELQFKNTISAGSLLAGPGLLLAVLLLISPILLCGDAYRIPPFENISTTRLPDGSYELSYDLYPRMLDFPSMQDTLKTVLLRVSELGGGVFLNIPSWDCLSGDIGENVPIGRGKRIVWNAPAESWYDPGIEYGLRLTVVESKYWNPQRSIMDRSHSNLQPPAVTPDRLQQLPEPVPTVPPKDKLVYIPGGTFSWQGFSYKIAGFYLSAFEVTQGEYEAVMGRNPAIQFGVGPEYPVYYVSWLDAVVYCNLRSMREGLKPCYSLAEYGTDPRAWPRWWDYLPDAAQANINCDFSASGYRLPREEEWLHAASGSDATYHAYRDAMLAARDSLGNDTICTQPVGSYAPNAAGIYDMHGNVAEWTWNAFSCLNDQFKGLSTDRDGFYDLHLRNHAVAFRQGQGAYWHMTAHEDFKPYQHWLLLVAGNVYDAVGFRVCRSSK